MSPRQETHPIIGHPVAEWLVARSPRRVVAESDPTPLLARHNIVVTATDPRTARHIIRDWERIEESDRQVGFLVLETGPVGPDEHDLPPDDDRGITRHTIAGALRIGIPAAIAGAIIVGVLTAIVVGGVGAVVGAALGGAALGATFGAVLGFASSSGWSSAYRESFVRPRPGATFVASFHTDDQRAQQLARLRVQQHTTRGVETIEAHDGNSSA